MVRQAGLETPTITEEHIDGPWIITTWANGLKTVSPIDSERFIRDSRILRVVGYREPKPESVRAEIRVSAHSTDKES